MKLKMKKILVILGLIFLTSVTCFAQTDDDDNNSGDKIREKMAEFIQRRMNLTKAETERFVPVFIRYFKDWRTTLRENRGDKPMLQLRVAELQIRYRPEFKEILGEKRCNLVYEHQQKFILEVQKMRQEQLQRRPLRRNRLMVD